MTRALIVDDQRIGCPAAGEGFVEGYAVLEGRASWPGWGQRRRSGGGGQRARRLEAFASKHATSQSRLATSGAIRPAASTIAACSGETTDDRSYKSSVMSRSTRSDTDRVAGGVAYHTEADLDIHLAAAAATHVESRLMRNSRLNRGGSGCNPICKTSRQARAGCLADAEPLELESRPTSPRHRPQR